MATITTAGSGNWDAGATWTGGSVPGDGDTASIESGHTCTLTENEQVGAVVINGGTIAGGGFKITCVKTSGRLFDHSGTITGNLDVELQGTHSTTEDFMGTGNIRNLTLNGSGLNVDIGRATTIDGNLTITQGTLHTNASSNHALTVTGNTRIGPASGGPDQATLTCNASTISLGSGKTDDYGLTVVKGGTFVGGTGTHTIGAIAMADFDDAKCTLTSGVTTMNGEDSGDNYAINIGGSSTFAHGSGTVTITRASDTRIRNSGADLALNNLIINHASAVITLASNGLTCAGDLTITAGEFGTGADKALTVTGALTNNGTLTLNGSTVNLGSTSTEAGDVTGSGTFNLDTSTINYHTAGGANFIPSTSANFDTNTSTLNLIGLNGSNRAHNFTFASGNMHNITTSRGAGTDTHTDTLNGNCTITGNLTVGANSNFSSGTRVFTVNGDVNVTGQLISNGSNKPMTFGSLTINSGGTYSATSGTTTLTKDDTGQFIYETISGATFTHNSGTLTITGDGRVKPRAGTGNFHNVILNSSGNTIEQGSDTTIDNDLTITAGEWSTGYSGFGYSNLTVTGDASVTGTLTGNTSIVSLGTLTLASGATYIATSGTTTITAANGAPVNGRAWYIPNSATFTHNNGLCKFTGSSPQVEMVSSGQTSTPNPFYDVEQTAGTMQWKGEHTKVLNNATLRGSQFNGSTGNLTVLGICRFTASSFNASDTSTSNNNFFGTLVIESGATVDVSAIDITVGSLRNLGGTIQ